MSNFLNICRIQLACCVMPLLSVAQSAAPFSVLAPVPVPVDIPGLNGGPRFKSLQIVPPKSGSDLEILVATTDGKIVLFKPSGSGYRQSGAIAALDPNRTGFLDVKTGDLTNHGRADLVVLNSDGDGSTIQVYLRQPDGSFAPPMKTTGPQTNGLSGALLIADLNQDGKPDLIISATGVSYVFLGRGDGSFQSPIFNPVAPLLIADFNNDGIPDILGRMGSGAAIATIFFGKGDGTFDGGHSSPQLLALSNNVAVGDFNGDGNLDVVVASNPITNFQLPTRFVKMQTFLGNGDGTFQAAQNFTGVGGPLAAADFNRDGKLDVICGYSVLLGQGDGTFREPVFLATPPYGCATGGALQFCYFLASAVSAADINADGLADVVVAYTVPTARGLYPDPTSVWTYTNDSPGDGFLAPAVSAATGALTVGEQSIVSGFGVGLAPTTASATGPPFPTSLGGIRLHVGDALAQLLYVSPSQINYVLPPLSGTQISIERVGQTFIPKGLGFLGDIDAPGIFTINQNGLAAATAVRIGPDGTQIPVPVFTCSAAGCVPVPIDTTKNSVYVSLYATGLNQLASDLGLGPDGGFYCPGAQVTYAGPQGQFPGLQQINLLFPQNARMNDPISCTNNEGSYIRVTNSVNLLFR